MPRYRGARAAAEQPEAIIKSCVNLLERQDGKFRARQLNCEWNAFQPLADLDHGRQIEVAEFERRHGQSGSVDDERHRIDPIGSLARDLEVRLELKQSSQALPQDGVILYQD